MAQSENQDLHVIVGLGETGLSCVRYLVGQGLPCMVVDSRENPPGLQELKKDFPDIEYELGGFNKATLFQAKELIMSPGVSLQTSEIADAISQGIPVTGDIDMFSRLVRAPLVAITGSNGKSTVVALLAEILSVSGKSFAVGGNLDSEFGKPALDLLAEGEKELFVLELSSFQLETTRELGAEVAVILNLSEDHMDRYDDMASYLAAKQRIFNGCHKVVVNRDEKSSLPPAQLSVPRWDFGFDEPGDHGVGLLEVDGERFLSYESEKIVAVDELKIVGQHNIANAMAATAVAVAMGIDLEVIRQGLQNFRGLPHRCQWLACINGVDYYNDSKATNVGATIAAVEGLGQHLSGHLLVIAGGVGKDADFAQLAPALNRWARELILIGEDAMQIAASVDKDLPVHFAKDLQEATRLAAGHAKTGDAVLLSPACASFDMFENFKKRGIAFAEAVQALQ